jgi:hypothetical protein
MLVHLPLLLLQASVGADDAALVSSLDEAIARAQARLVRGVDLWEDHSAWENAWRVETENYVVRSTQSRYLAADLAEGLEARLALFRETLMTDEGWRPPQPFQIQVLPTLDDYRQFGDQHGAEHSSFYGSFYPSGHPERPVATYLISSRAGMRMFVTHGAFHQFLDRAYDRELPPALAEGLASYFALLWDWGYAITELEKMAREGRLLPLRELVTASTQQFTDRSHERLIQLGMLVAYLIHYHPETRTVRAGDEIWQAGFSEYLDLLLTGDDAQLHPVHDLLTSRLDELERDFRAFEFPR